MNTASIRPPMFIAVRELRCCIMASPPRAT
jgi:hypothetical protein